MLPARVVHLVALSCFVAVVRSRECFQCTYNYWERNAVEDCLDTFDASTESPGVTRVNCDGKCAKMRYRRNSSTTVVMRTCVMSASVLDSCLHGCFQSRDYRETCVWCCDEDMCNGAGAVTRGHRSLAACACAAALALIGRLLV